MFETWFEIVILNDLVFVYLIKSHEMITAEWNCGFKPLIVLAYHPVHDQGLTRPLPLLCIQTVTTSGFKCVRHSRLLNVWIEVSHWHSLCNFKGLSRENKHQKNDMSMKFVVQKSNPWTILRKLSKTIKTVIKTIQKTTVDLM